MYRFLYKFENKLKKNIFAKNIDKLLENFKN